MDLTISSNCRERLRLELPLTGSFQSATLFKIQQCLSDLHMCLDGMDERQALLFARDELLPLESLLWALTRAALAKGER